MKSLLVLCPIQLKASLVDLLSIYKRNSIRFCISEDNQININALKNISRLGEKVTVGKILSMGIDIDNINTITEDTEVPIVVRISRDIIYPYNYNLKVSDEIKRCIKDVISVGYNINCNNEIEDILTHKKVKVTGTISIKLSSSSEMELNALTNNYILLGNREEVLDPLGIISSKITTISGDRGTEVGFSYGKVIKSLELFGQSYIDYS